MKSHIRCAGWLVLPIFFLTLNLPAAVTFTNLPGAVSNTYLGTITFQIAGVPTGDTVVIQKFADANTNGVVDSGDTLVQQFSLTDGQAPPVFSGVTNYNVPGDLNPAAGNIMAVLNFHNGDFSQAFTGRYLYVLSSPAGHFTSITNSFAVTNLPYPQSLTGSVVSNGTATILPGAFVLLFPPPRPGHDLGSPVGGAIANNAGAYNLPLPPGSYVAVAFKSNYVANYSAAPLLTLSSGQTLTNNISATAATSSISGTLVDAATNSIGLPGAFFPVMQQSPNILLATVFTGTNGNYSVGVTSGQWSFGGTDGLNIHGYVEFGNNNTNASAGASGVLDEIPKGTAIIYGSIKDLSGNPVPGVAAAASDNEGNYYTDGFTGTNGNYVAAALGGLSGDTWQAQIDMHPTNYVFSQASSQQDGGITLNVGDAVEQDFTAVPTTGTIYGHVQDNFGNPIAGVSMFASATIDAIQFNQGNANTDSNGTYTMNVADGSWTVGVSYNSGNGSLSSGYELPPTQTINISANSGLANFTVQTNVNSGGSLHVVTTSLPSGMVGAAYDQELTADGDGNGTPDFWQVVSGSLPPGLSMDALNEGFISGAPTSSGTFNFTAEVTDQNNNHNTAGLSIVVNPGVALGSLSWNANQFQVRLSGPSGRDYTIQASTNLSPANWVPVFVTNNTASNSFIFTDAGATNRQKYYRAVLGP